MRTIVTSVAFTLFVASSASAASLPLATVGQADPLVATTNLANSGEDTEMAWIASVLNIPVGELEYQKIGASGGANWSEVDGRPDLFAFDFGSGADPAWFMVKTGAGSQYSNFLFENSPNLQYGVIDFDELGFDKIDIGKVSHVSTAGGEGGGGSEEQQVPVPEPASLTLLGLGLAGVAARRRRRKA